MARKNAAPSTRSTAGARSRSGASAGSTSSGSGTGKTRDAWTRPDPAHRIVVLAGSDIFLRSHYTNLYADALREAHGEVEIIRHDGETAQLADVLDDLRSMGLMQQHRLVVVESAEALVRDTGRATMERFAADPSPHATLILRSGSWRAGKLDELIRKAGAIVPCEPPATSAAAAWARGRAKHRYGKDLSIQCAANLVDLVGSDLGRLDAEIAKLAVASADEPAIRPALIDELVGEQRTEDPFTIQPALLGTDPQEALRELRRRIELAPRDAHIPVTYACADLARKLHGVAEGFAQRHSAFDLARELKLWGPTKDALLAVGQRLPTTTTLRLLDAAAKADLHAKTGVGDPVRTLQVLAIQMTGRASLLL